MTVITASFAVERLAEIGLDRGERDAKRSLFDLVLGRSGELEAGVPEHLFWVPGRLEVFGKHTDYAGGHSLVSAVPRGFVKPIEAAGSTAGLDQWAGATTCKRSSAGSRTIFPA
jgi:hypothetical protein